MVRSHNFLSYLGLTVNQTRFALSPDRFFTAVGETTSHDFAGEQRRIRNLIGKALARRAKWAIGAVDAFSTILPPSKRDKLFGKPVKPINSEAMADDEARMRALEEDDLDDTEVASQTAPVIQSSPPLPPVASSLALPPPHTSALSDSFRHPVLSRSPDAISSRPPPGLLRANLASPPPLATTQQTIIVHGRAMAMPALPSGGNTPHRPQVSSSPRLTSTSNRAAVTPDVNDLIAGLGPLGHEQIVTISGVTYHITPTMDIVRSDTPAGNGRLRLPPVVAPAAPSLPVPSPCSSDNEMPALDPPVVNPPKPRPKPRVNRQLRANPEPVGSAEDFEQTETSETAGKAVPGTQAAKTRSSKRKK